MEKKWICKLGHTDYPSKGGFRVYETGKVYDASEVPEDPGLPYWELVTSEDPAPPAESKKKTGGKK